MPRLYQGLQIITPMSEIEKMVAAESCKVLNTKIPHAIKDIENDISNTLKHVFVNSPEYDSLTSGDDLAKAFGIPQSDAIKKLDTIIDVLASSIVVKFKRLRASGTTITGGIEVGAFLANFKDILRLPEAQVITDKGQSLPWLEWLLIRGDTIIITDFEISFGSYPTSRAGGALMVESVGGVWRVPPQYSGIITDNWITRAVDASAKFLEGVCLAVMKRNIEKTF